MTLIPGIKQISQVGNDMYAQGAITIAGIGTTNVDYLADPADTRLLAGRDPVIEEVSVGISGVETDLKYATGTQPLTVTDAIRGNLTYCEVQFSPKQDLHGYDSPWPAGGGKNIANPANVLHGYYSAQNPSNFVSNEAYRTLKQTLGAGTYTFTSDLTNLRIIRWAINNTSTQTNYDPPLTFTIESEGVVQICFRNKDTTDITEDFNVQLEAGSTVGSFTPYSNICPISGWQGAEVYIEPTYDPTATPKASVTFGQTVYGGTAEIVAGTGSEAWNTYSTYTISAVETSSQGVAYAKLSAPSDAKTNGIVKAECYANTGNGATNNACRFAGGSLYVYDNRFVDVTTATALLSGIVFYYELLIPTTFTFPGAPDITLQDGTNTIWADTNGTDISVTYVTKK